MMHTPPQKGFSLVETLVAITLLAIALVGPFIAVRNALLGSYIARDQLIASMLAQEGMEYLRSIRDNNYLAGRAWIDGFQAAPRDGCFGANPSMVCTLDPTRGDFHTDSSGMLEHANVSAAPVLKLSATNLYNQQTTTSTNVNTPFKRTVQITQLSASEIRVIITVSWSRSGQNYSTVVTDVLRDWL